MCTPQERDFSLISLSSTSAWYLQQRWYLGRTWSRWRGKKGGKMKARREVGKERQKEGAGEGEWVRREIYVLQHMQLGQFSSPCSWALWQGKEVAASAPAYSPVFSPQGFLMKNSYTNTWSVFTNTAEKQRKMKTGSWFYPRGISPGILGLLSLCELCPPQETSSWQNRDPKKGKKRKPTRPCGVWFPVALFLGHVYWADGGGPDSSRDKHIFSVSFSANLPPWLCWCGHLEPNRSQEILSLLWLMQIFLPHTFILQLFLDCLPSIRHCALLRIPSCATASRGKAEVCGCEWCLPVAFCSFGISLDFSPGTCGGQAEPLNPLETSSTMAPNIQSQKPLDFRAYVIQQHKPSPSLAAQECQVPLSLLDPLFMSRSLISRMVAL